MVSLYSNLTWWPGHIWKCGDELLVERCKTHSLAISELHIERVVSGDAGSDRTRERPLPKNAVACRQHAESIGKRKLRRRVVISITYRPG